MKYNFTKVELTDLNGKKAKGKDLHKNIAQILYLFANGKNLSLIDKAIEINKGVDVELTDEEANTIKELCLATKPEQLFAFAKKGICDYIDKIRNNVGKK